MWRLGYLWYICGVTHLYVWLLHVWLFYMCDSIGLSALYVWYDSFICVVWLICMCVWRCSYLLSDPFTCVTWLDRVICVEELICMCVSRRVCLLSDSFTCVTWLICVGQMWRLGYYLCHVWYDSFMCVFGGTGWRRLIGSPKLQIIFHKIATKYRSLLRKMTCKDKGSYESSPPCIGIYNIEWVIHMCDMTDLSWANVAIELSVLYVVWLIYICVWRYRVAKTHRIPYLYRSFSAKVTYI